MFVSNERLNQPGSQKNKLSPEDLQIRNTFRSEILDLIEGRNLKDIDGDYLRDGFGAPQSLSKILRLLQVKKGKDRQLLVNALGSLLDDKDVKTYTKAALLLFFDTSIDLSEIEDAVDRLAESSEADDQLLHKRLGVHFMFRKNLKEKRVG